MRTIKIRIAALISAPGPVLDEQVEIDVEDELEAAQLLCSCFPAGFAPYRPTHHAHPLAVWTRATIANYRFVAAYCLAVADEYARRYGREHASRAVALRCLDLVRPEHVPDGDLLEPVQVVPEDCRVPGDHVAAYRAYYVRDKARLASWRAPAERPSWWP